MTGDKTDTAEELADAAGVDGELVRQADESVRNLRTEAEAYTTDVSELDVGELKNKLRRIHQQQERLAKEAKVIEAELIKRAPKNDTPD